MGCVISIVIPGFGLPPLAFPFLRCPPVGFRFVRGPRRDNGMERSNFANLGHRLAAATLQVGDLHPFVVGQKLIYVDEYQQLILATEHTFDEFRVPVMPDMGRRFDI